MATLMQSGKWFAVSVGPAAGILERVMPGTSSPADLRERGVSFSKLAFRNETVDPPATRLVATPPSFYERYVYRTRSFTDASKREARNFLQFAQVPAQSLPDIMTSISNSTLAIRRLNQSLAANPGDAESYEMLFRAYGQLGAMEQSVLTGQSAGRLRQLRYFQSIAACHQALIINPDSLFAWDGLAAAYQQLGRQDLLVTALSNWVRIAEPLPEFEEGVLGEELIRRKQGLAELREQVETANAQITKDMEDRRKQAEQAQLGQPSGDTPTAPGAPSPEQILLAQLALAEATLANTNGLPGRALQTLKDNQALLQSDPYARLLLGQLLLENGEIEDATAILPGLKLDAESQPAMFASLEWHLPVATLEMVLANYSLASATFGNQLAAINKRATDGAPDAGVLFSLPLVADVQFNALNMPVPIWPVQNAASTVESMQAVGEVRSEILLLAALTSIEAGDMKAARNHLQAIITECGDTGSRPLAMLYYSVATEQEETQKLFDSLALNGTEEYLFPGEVLPTMEQLQQAAQAAQAAQGAAAGAMPPAGARGQTGAAGQPGAAGSGATSNPPGAGPAGAAPVRLSPGSLPGGAPQP
jgi:tetratricopeptide (TPR) repeat protein